MSPWLAAMCTMAFNTCYNLNIMDTYICLNYSTDTCEFYEKTEKQINYTKTVAIDYK